jgi:heme exporter protein B
LWQASRLVFAKDMRIELRSRVAMQQVATFGAIVLVLFAFGLDPKRGLLPRVAPGLFWVAVLLAALLAIGRSFAIEAANDARDGLRLAGLDSGAVFLGKGGALVCQLAALEALLAVGIFVLYDIEVAGVAALVSTLIAATVGIAAAGTVYGALVAGLRTRETLLPVLLLPVLAPVMLGGTRAFESALAGDTGEAWPWVQLLTVFAAVYVVIGVLVFDTLWEES